MSSDGIFAQVKDWRDDEWFALLDESTSGASVGGLPMPTFPPADVQTAIHGTANEMSLPEAILLYGEVIRYADVAGRPVSSERTLLDFGTGWGRMLRPFMKDIPGSKIYGCEPNPERVVLARQCNPYVNFVQSDYLPPLQLRTASIDFVIAYSVFSHLNELATNAWIVEFTRILTSGGVMFVTTQGTAFFAFCERLHVEKQGLGVLPHPWQEALVRRFPDPAEARRRYERGEYVWAGEPANQYGEAAIPAEYVREHWLGDLELIAFVDDRRRLPQTLIVLRKPVRSSIPAT